MASVTICSDFRAQESKICNHFYFFLIYLPRSDGTSKFGKLSNGHKPGKGQFLFQSQRKVMPKKCSNYCTIALTSHTSKVMLKILQARLPQHMNCELLDVQAGFRKGRGTRDQIANIHWIVEKQESSRKTSISALLTMPKPLTVWITINCGKF